MNILVSKVFPVQADNNFHGSIISLYFFFVITLLSFIRSLVHILYKDGGTKSIATLKVSKEGVSCIDSKI